MIRVTTLWPRTNDSHFDMEYYLTKHVPMTNARLQSLGFSVVSEVDEGLGSLTPGEPPPYAAIGTLLFETMEDLQKGLAAHGAEIRERAPRPGRDGLKVCFAKELSALRLSILDRAFKGEL